MNDEHAGVPVFGPHHLREFFAYIAAARKWARLDPALEQAADIQHLLRAFPEEAYLQCETAAEVRADELAAVMDALATSERKLRLATDAAELGIWSWDMIADEVIWENERPFAFFGIDRTEGPINAARFVSEFLEKDDAPAFASAIEHTRRTGERFSFLGRFRRRDGERRWIEFTGQPTPIAGGNGRHMFGTAADVTTRKTQQLAVERSEARLRRVFESNVVGMIRWNLDHSLILDANQEFFRITGYTREDVAEGRLNFRALTPPEWTPRNEDGIRTIREQGFAAPYEKEYFRNDGSRVPLIIAGTRFDDAPSEGMSFLIDITERKRVEAAMRQNAALFSTLIEQAPVGVYVVDAQFRLQQLKPVAMPAFESVRPLVGRDFGEVMEILWGPEVGGKLTSIFRHTLETGERISPSFSEQRQDLGEEHAYEWETQRVTLPDGQHGVVCYFSDVTERHRAAAALQEAKDAAEAANRSKDRFLAVLSHELRTPLTPVLMTIGALEHDPELSGEVREDLAMMKRNLELETKLIDDLLDLSRITSGKLSLQIEPLDLNEMVRRVCGICLPPLRERGIRLESKLDDAAGFVAADRARLQQVFWNVLKNAIKFTPESGTIRVTTQRLADDRGEVRMQDNGVGIPAAVLPRIFDAFEQGDPGVTRQFGGLGLGLAISKAVMDLHHGSIRAESDGTGRGATFVIELPGAAPASAAPSTGIAPAGGGSLHSLRVLLVEDHADTSRTLERLLRRAGLVVVSAADLASAIERAEEENFDVLVSDLGLPDGTGYEVIRRVRARQIVPGIAMSGYGMEEDVRRTREGGFTEHLVKPIDVGQLIAAIRRVATDHG